MASTARLEELKKKFDENPRRYFAPLANEHRKSGDLDQAISLCRAHLPQQPAHISGHIVLAQALFEAGQLDESRDSFQSALELDPENLIGLRYLGDIARQSGDVPTARSWYQRVLEVDPRNDEIVQLVRELDAPSPATEPVGAAPETEDAVATPPAPSFARPAAPHVTPSAEANARFAPLSIDQIDVDSEAPSAPEAVDSTADFPAAEQGAPEETFDVHADWSTDAATVELPMLDAPDLDPFEMPASASANALAGTDAHYADADLLGDFAGLASEADATDVEGATDAAASWDASWPEAAAETGESPEASDTSRAPTPTEAQPFEEGAFYLESGNDSPEAVAHSASEGESVESYPTPDVPADAAIVDVEALAPQATAARVDGETAGDVPTPGALEDAADIDLEPEATVASSEVPREAGSELPSATAAVEQELGLEVMEFVPPDAGTGSGASDPAAAPMEMEADPLLGHMPELAPTEQGAAPAAFVTETLAELYLQQGFRSEALSVYRELLARNPDDQSLRDRIDQIESGSMSSIGIATLSENVVESAMRRQTARPARTVRSLFASLAGRRAPYRAPAEFSEAESYYETPVDDPSTEPPTAAPTEATGAESPAPEEPQAPARVASSPPRSLNELFPEAHAEPRAESAAETLATAFGRGEPQGRPTRAASNELSLDHVFRGAPEGAPAADGGFSFDQFFSDSRSASGEVSTAAAASPPDTDRSGGGDAHDIEQFTAWLEGLKKK